ncbi:MAG: type II toxin-antitoxin system RelE/ParE family toxin [Gammaproteobacteria bacterium]|nr:type II toxin-antitoxin system RelE/ParE family toxin [Gammaproteobacteria bacterium]MDP2139590.1 type II toxin-antitoxin system RelE/ParE family toxin [Gammaproteobacteria bacterium]MDP2346563.1 type II toxin-antitoxin system RelE/ParE family toxin [Gammaproteobacteria bacterium]
MASYELIFRKSVARDMRTIPNRDVARILHCIDALQHNPRPGDCEKLSGQEKYRLRQGKYRIVYETRDTDLVVCVVKVGHRSSVYRK